MQHLSQLFERIARRIKPPQYDATNATMNVADPSVAFRCCALRRHGIPGLIRFQKCRIPCLSATRKNAVKILCLCGIYAIPGRLYAIFIRTALRLQQSLQRQVATQFPTRIADRKTGRQKLAPMKSITAKGL
jgi:hypothetical protein